ncbi:thiolase family protein [Cupriavidus basilensis]
MQNTKESIVIVGAKRTPIGAFNGSLVGVRGAGTRRRRHPRRRGAGRVDPVSVDEAIMGLCLFAGVGQAPARQAVLGAALPTSTPATTISKMCGSGMKSVMLAHDLLLAGTCNVAVAGGMESMTNAPHIVPRARHGYRLGHGQLLDHMYRDGLEDAFEGHLMGYYADLAAEARGIGREAQDAYARESLLRAQAAVAEGRFRGRDRTGRAQARRRGCSPRMRRRARCDAARLPKLKAVFRAGGTVTAGNASSISDGAAALVLMRESDAARSGRDAAGPHRRSRHACQPAAAIRRCACACRTPRARQGGPESARDVDLYEINEAFAVVTIYFGSRRVELGIGRRPWGLNVKRRRVRASATRSAPPGARPSLVTLVHALKQRGRWKRGLLALCSARGGGEAHRRWRGIVLEGG